MINTHNVDPKVVEDFGNEWEVFNQRCLDDAELKKAFDQYFTIFPFHKINSDSVGFDMGCGSGRWAKVIAPSVGKLNCIDPSSKALMQAKINLSSLDNCEFECASVSESKLELMSQDFGYCLGVLHHIPDTLEGLRACASKLKSGAPFLLYLYYRFDNKPFWYKSIWILSDLIRRLLSILPFRLKFILSQLIAALVYFPLARMAKLMSKMGLDVSNMPLSDYRNKSFYFMRTDALDRFGTKLEKRFTKSEMLIMLHESGFRDVKFNDAPPFWVAVAIKI